MSDIQKALDKLQEQSNAFEESLKCAERSLMKSMKSLASHSPSKLHRLSLADLIALEAYCAQIEPIYNQLDKPEYALGIPEYVQQRYDVGQWWFDRRTECAVEIQTRIEELFGPEPEITAPPPLIGTKLSEIVEWPQDISNNE